MANPKTDKPKTPKAPSHVELYFDERDGSYWYRLNGRYISMKKSDLQMHLRTLGLSEINWITQGEGHLKEIDWPFWNALANHGVAYAGSLAGHRVGVYRDGASRAYLVTDEASGVWDDMPKKVSEPKFFSAFIQELLPDDQWLFVGHWLALSLRSLRRGDFAPGQVLVLAGPAQCGKSLLQNIITEILGGRSANPYRYMMGLSQFNKDLACAEHWQMEDPGGSTDIRTRREFGAMLKEVTVNRDFSIHQKGKDALLLPLFRRASMSVNNETECLATVPPMEPSIRDKVHLCKCEPVHEAFAEFRVVNGTRALPNMPETKSDGELDRKALWEGVKKEIPQIRAWLLNRFSTVPTALRDDRFGILAYHNPELLSELTNLAPETRLLQLIDEVCFEKDNPAPVTGKSIDIEKALRGSSFNFECDRLLRYSGAMGSYLGKLAKSCPERVTKHVKDGYTSWAIKTPTKTAEPIYPHE